MLSPTISTLILIIIVSVALSTAISGKTPDGNRIITFPFRCLRAMTSYLRMRKGIIWTSLVWLSVLALVVDVTTIFQGLHLWKSVQTIILFSAPPAIGWILRHYCRSIQARRFQLPKRKRT